MKDEVYSKPRQQIVDFAFDDAVADVFPDMIRRSVPGYETVTPLSGLLGARHLQSGTRAYDLGCSLGATSLALLSQIDDMECEIIAVDNSPAMLARAREMRDWDPRVRFENADVLELNIKQASVVFMNYLMQFIGPEQRLTLLQNINSGLVPGGVLILSEKLAGEEEFDGLHAAFKRANGYSDLEIAQKRAALENVLLPETLANHKQRIAGAGFSSCDVWFQCFNFASLVALK